MHKEVQPTFSAPFMKRYGIKPIVVDPRTLDIEDGLFIEELMTSLKSGYDPSRPVIVAKSDDERVDGQVIDGRHRLYCLAKLQERGVKLPSPFPISYLDVTDVDHLRALIAHYEERNRSKGAKYAKAHIEKNLKAIVSDNIEVQGKGITSFIESLGFKNKAMIAKVVDDYIGKPKQKKAPKTRKVVGLPESPDEPWSDTSVYAKPGEELDIKASYHNCPACKALLKVSTNDKGDVVSIQNTVPKIEK